MRSPHQFVQKVVHGAQAVTVSCGCRRQERRNVIRIFQVNNLILFGNYHSGSKINYFFGGRFSKAGRPSGK